MFYVNQVENGLKVGKMCLILSKNVDIMIVSTPENTEFVNVRG